MHYKPLNSVRSEVLYTPLHGVRSYTINSYRVYSGALSYLLADELDADLRRCGRAAASLLLVAGHGVLLERLLDRLDLLRAGRQHALFQAVELVEAAPGAHLAQADEDSPHRLSEHQQQCRQ